MKVSQYIVFGLSLVTIPTSLFASVATFVNNTPYVLTLNSAPPTPPDAYCIDSNQQQADCAAVLPKGASQLIYINASAGFNLNYNLDALGVNNFNLYIGNWSGSGFSHSNTSVEGTQIVQEGDTLTLQANVEPQLSPAQYGALPFRGVSLSGAEAGSGYLPNWLPSPVDMYYFTKMGMNTARFPINWNYLFVAKNASGDGSYTIDPVYAQSILAATQELLEIGNNVVLDVHDYMRYGYNQPAGNGTIVTPDQMQQMWGQIATLFASLAAQYDGKNTKNQLIFELMNEPNSMDTGPGSAGQPNVLNNSNAGIAAIRSVMKPGTQNPLDNLIFIEGNGWSGMHSWFQVTGNDNGINANALIPKNIHDPLNHYAIAVHQYFDSNGSGTQPICQTLSNFKAYNVMIGYTDSNNTYHPGFITDYVNKYKVPVVLSEFGSGPTAPADANATQDCGNDVNWLLSQMEAVPYDATNGGFIGWMSWVGGHGWSMANFNNLVPSNITTCATTPSACKQQSQMLDIYEQHLTPVAATNLKE